MLLADSVHGDYDFVVVDDDGDDDDNHDNHDETIYLFNKR